MEVVSGGQVALSVLGPLVALPAQQVDVGMVPRDRGPLIFSHLLRKQSVLFRLPCCLLLLLFSELNPFPMVLL